MLLENLPDRIKTVVDCNSNEESKHRVFVMNMTCGESILNETSRGSILSGWGYVLFWLFFCAKWLNAIPSYYCNILLSFACRAVIPARVCGPLGELISKWVATSLPLMDIIGQTLTRPYVEDNQPVFSSQEFTGFHFTLVGSGRALVGGLQAVCPNGCNEEIASSSNSARVDGKSAWKYRFTCTKCRFIAKTKICNGEDLPQGLNRPNGDGGGLNARGLQRSRRCQCRGCREGMDGGKNGWLKAAAKKGRGID